MVATTRIVFIPNGISIGLSVFEGLIGMPNGQTHRETTPRHDICSTSPHSIQCDEDKNCMSWKGTRARLRDTYQRVAEMEQS